MPAKLEEITAVFLRERFRREDFVIADIRGANGQVDHVSPIPTSAKGTAEVGELEPGLEYRFYGRREQYRRRDGSTEGQFAFKTFVQSQPHERRGVILYLQKAPHVGPATAKKLWEKFKGQAVRMLREEPEAAAVAIGAGESTAKKFVESAAALADMAHLESVHIDLINTLHGRGFPKKTAKEAVTLWGNRAAKLIERNPFLLMAFRGCGFLRTYAMYLDLGLPPGRLKVQALCAWHALASDTEGHTWYSVQHIINALRDKINGAQVNPAGACLLARRAGMIESRRDADGGLWFAEAKAAQAERYVAECVAAATKEEIRWPDTMAINGLSDHQLDNVAKTFAGPIGILGGAPGTGKTYTAAATIETIVNEHGGLSVMVCAPTGKAAVRLQESMLAYGLSIEAKTIHRTLGVESLEGGAWTFAHNEANPLPCQFVVVDESSMIDTALMAHLLAARAKGTHVLLVGDVNQLPPVGRGAPLRDLIAAGVPYGELREIRRNSGSIVQVCHTIRDNKRWMTDDQLDPDADDPRNLKLVPAKNGKEATDRIVEILRKIRDGKLADPIWETQVVCAVNKKSDLSRQNLNQRLQIELNPQEKVEGSPFRLHDKVIQLKNKMVDADVTLPARTEARCFCLHDGETDEDDPCPFEVRGTDKEVFAKADLHEKTTGHRVHVQPIVPERIEQQRVMIANGEQGLVVEVREKLTVVRFPNPDRLVKIPRGKQEADSDGKPGDDDASGTGCDLDLAYAISVHKAQGSEWPIVIVALDEYPGAQRVCDRAWLYTAISRAKRACFLAGKLSTAHAMCRRNSIVRRKTFLKELIQECSE